MADTSINAAMAALEEMLERALDEAESARAGNQRERLRAFVEILSWGKAQAQILDLPPFANRSLNQIDPESLLTPVKQAA